MKRFTTVKHRGVQVMSANALVRVIGGIGGRFFDPDPPLNGGEGPQDSKRPLPAPPRPPVAE